ncbi:hypothetical protein DFH28DRAFT_919558 [Melampsora americana]|nr:hypothetical protein DFH28DRAFT_919558 [Melampsora americana]
MAASGEGHGLHTSDHTQDIATHADRINTTSSVNTQNLDQPPQKRKRCTKKNKKKSQRSLTDAELALDSDSENEEPMFDPATVKDSNKTAVELRFLAVKYASSCLSDTVVESLMNFHEEMETLIAIKALELGITVSDIERVFGKFIGVRKPSAWNRFLQSPLARQIFKEARGVGNGTGMKVLSQKWKSMTPAEKEVYKQATQEADTTTIDNLDGQLQDIGVGSQSRYSVLQPRSNTVANARNLKQYKDKAEHFVEETLAKAVKMLYKMDGVQDFPTRLQSLIVGQTPSQLSASISESGRAFQTRVVKSLSSFLYETTNQRNWPWSKCDATLGDAGFQLHLLPGARSLEQTFKEPSAGLNRAKLLALEADLKDNMIQLVKINRNPRFENHHPIQTEINESQHNEPNSSLATSEADNNIDTTQGSEVTTEFNRSIDNHNPSPQ